MVFKAEMDCSVSLDLVKKLQVSSLLPCVGCRQLCHAIWRLAQSCIDGFVRGFGPRSHLFIRFRLHSAKVI